MHVLVVLGVVLVVVVLVAVFLVVDPSMYTAVPSRILLRDYNVSDVPRQQRKSSYFQRAKSATDPNVQVIKVSGSSNRAQIRLVVDGWWWLLTMIKQYSIQLNLIGQTKS